LIALSIKHFVLGCVKPRVGEVMICVIFQLVFWLFAGNKGW
jgi:hypothetical protein